MIRFLDQNSLFIPITNQGLGRRISYRGRKQTVEEEESDFPLNGLTGHYDASVIGLADTDPIEDWDDLSVSDNHLNTAHGVFPIVASADKNSLDTAEFTVANAGIRNSSVTPGLISGNAFSIFIIAKIISTTDFRRIFQLVSVSSSIIFAGEAGGSNLILTIDGTDTNTVTLPDTTDYHLYTLMGDPVAENTRVAIDDGADNIAEATTFSIPADNIFYLGASGGAISPELFIAEAMIYSRALNAQEISEVKTYLNNKWAIY